MNLYRLGGLNLPRLSCDKARLVSPKSPFSRVLGVRVTSLSCSVARPEFSPYAYRMNVRELMDPSLVAEG
jgi:hypothetical protein